MEQDAVDSVRRLGMSLFCVLWFGVMIAGAMLAVAIFVRGVQFFMEIL